YSQRELQQQHRTDRGAAVSLWKLSENPPSPPGRGREARARQGEASTKREGFKIRRILSGLTRRAFNQGPALSLQGEGLACALCFFIVTLSASAAPVRLIDAVKAADKDAIRTLLQQRVDVNAAEPDGTTALHWAGRTSDLQAAEMLIRAGANVKSANRYG